MDLSNFKFTDDHEWIHIEDNLATVGISEHATQELGEIVFVELPATDKMINQKDEFGTVESVKTVSSLYAPVSGKITHINSDLENQPELVGESPYANGWIVKIELSDSKEIDDLMTFEEYSNYIETL